MMEIELELTSHSKDVTEILEKGSQELRGLSKEVTGIRI